MTAEPDCDEVVAIEFVSRCQVQIDFQPEPMTLAER
jgi:hypothetical protein